MKLLLRACVVWLAIAGAETVHGVARGLLLAPRLGELRARQVGVVLGSLLVLGVAWLGVRWIGASGRAELLGVGALWLVLMLGFEIGLGRALGLEWRRVLSDYDPRQGGFMLVGMGVLLFAPLLVGRAGRTRGSPAAGRGLDTFARTE